MLTKIIEQIIAHGEIYALEDQNGIAVSQSLLFQMEDGSPVPVICFWSDKEKAKKCCVEDWAKYRVTAICLATFLEDWLVQIYNDSFIVGFDFSNEMKGIEADPLDTILLLVNQLKKQKIELELEYFKDLKDLENQTKGLMKKV